MPTKTISRTTLLFMLDGADLTHVNGTPATLNTDGIPTLSTGICDYELTKDAILVQERDKVVWKNSFRGEVEIKAFALANILPCDE